MVILWKCAKKFILTSSRLLLTVPILKRPLQLMMTVEWAYIQYNCCLLNHMLGFKSFQLLR